MATFTAIKNKKQTAGVLGGVLKYVQQEKKTRAGVLRFVTGHNCVPQSAYTEMVTTKRRFKKTDGRQFYHFVQSFAETDNLTPQEANAIGLELAQREFPGFEVVVATHLDTNHLHNHLIVNSVSCETGRKLHQSADDLLRHRQVNDEICAAHGLSVLEQPEKRSKKKRMKPGEYQAGLREDSWKMDLIHAINEALEYADSRESFIANMEQEGYEVIWTDARKHITSSVQTDGSAGTAVCTTRRSSKRIWRHCLFTGRPLASAPAVWSRTKAGWASWQRASFSWAGRWNGWMIYRRFPLRPHGRTTSSAAGRR